MEGIVSLDNVSRVGITVSQPFGGTHYVPELFPRIRPSSLRKSWHSPILQPRYGTDSDSTKASSVAKWGWGLNPPWLSETKFFLVRIKIVV